MRGQMPWQVVKKYSIATTLLSIVALFIFLPSWLVKENGRTVLMGGITGLVKPGIIKDMIKKKPTTSTAKKAM
jgi:hypothetical protein